MLVLGAGNEPWSQRSLRDAPAPQILLAQGNLRPGAASQGILPRAGAANPNPSLAPGFKGLHKQRRALNSSSSRGGQEKPSQIQPPARECRDPAGSGLGSWNSGRALEKILSKAGVKPGCSKAGPGSCPVPAPAQTPTFPSPPCSAPRASIPGIPPWHAQGGKREIPSEFWEFLSQRSGWSPPGIPAPRPYRVFPSQGIGRRSLGIPDCGVG